MNPMHTYIAMMVAALMVIVGWLATHEYASFRDKANKQREIRTSFLIGAYRSLENNSHRPLTEDGMRAIEAAIADIQLLGSPELRKLITEFKSHLARDISTPPGPLLFQLRKELLAELGISDSGSDFETIRFNRTAPPPA